MLLLCFSLITIPLTAQNADSDNEIGRHGIGLVFGVPGIGLDYGYRLNPNIMFRLRGQTLPFSVNDYDFEIDDQDVLVDLDMNLTQIGVVVDYHPFSNSSFKLIGGLTYFVQSKIDVGVLVSDTLFLGENNDFVFYPEDIGRIDIKTNWNSVVPYIGLGFGRAVPKKRVGFGIELGTHYVNSPKVQVLATGMLEDTSESGPQLENDLADFKWLPQFNFRLSIRL